MAATGCAVCVHTHSTTPTNAQLHPNWLNTISDPPKKQIIMHPFSGGLVNTATRKDDGNHACMCHPHRVQRSWSVYNRRSRPNPAATPHVPHSVPTVPYGAAACSGLLPLQARVCLRPPRPSGHPASQLQRPMPGGSQHTCLRGAQLHITPYLKLIKTKKI